MKILVPQGMGDSLWALPKVAAIARSSGDRRVDLRVACWSPTPVEGRAVELLRRFSIVDSVKLYETPRTGPGAVLRPGPAVGPDGIYRYLPDGHTTDLPGIDWIAIPNSALDRGIRLERWLPEYRTDWSVFDTIRLYACERLRAEALEWTVGPFAVFFMGSQAGNTKNGWNRGSIWRPADWIELGDRLHDALGIRVVVIGAQWDMDYWKANIADAVRERPHWISLIGELTVCETAAVLQRARCVVSYPSGIGILSHYLRRPTVMFFRAHGDPIEASLAVSPDDGLATAWTYPDTEPGAYLPAIYGRVAPSDIVAHAVANGW